MSGAMVSLETFVTEHLAERLGPRFKFFKRSLRLVFHKAIQLNVALKGRKYRYVFVLAHMRSGSTLLSHILAGNPKFAHAGETFLSYKTPADLQTLILEVSQRLRKISLSATYVIDQINHQLVTDDVLKSPLIYKCVILIRAPEAALKSEIATHGKSENYATEYYINRLSQLVEYGRILGNRALLVEYDDLVGRPKEVLAALTEFFGVTPPFDEEYPTHRITGKIGGDTSKNIWTGRIVQTQPHSVDISPGALAETTTAFENCKRQLLSAGVQVANEVHAS